MRLEELINAMLRECMRISANVRDYAIFYWPFCSSRIESHEAVRQDVCCRPTLLRSLGPTTPPLTRLRLDGILLCEADGRCRDKGATGTERSHFSQLLVWPIFNLPMCNKLSFFISCCVYDEYAVMTICWGDSVRSDSCCCRCTTLIAS